MLIPSALRADPGHQSMRKGLPSAPQIRSQKLGRPAWLMLLCLLMSLWEPLNGLHRCSNEPATHNITCLAANLAQHFHQGRRQTPCGPQGVHTAGERAGRSLHTPPRTHTPSQTCVFRTQVRIPLPASLYLLSPSCLFKGHSIEHLLHSGHCPLLRA